MTEHSDSVVFIGKKPFMNYVTGVVMQFNSGIKKVTIKARGKYISRAVDVAEVVRNRFVQEVKLNNINIASEEFEGEDGKKVRISTIEITLTKGWFSAFLFFWNAKNIGFLFKKILIVKEPSLEICL